MSQRSLPIAQNDTGERLSVKLSNLGSDLLIETLPAYLSGHLMLKEQDSTHATYAPMLKKEDGLLDFGLPAIDLDRQVRAFNPWPGTFMEWNGQILKVHHVHVVNQPTDKPGKHLVIDGTPAITTAQGILVLDDLQLAGRKIQTGQEFLRGIRNW